MKTIFILTGILLISSFVFSLPSSFDLRVQPSMIKYADYSLKPEGICVAHAWGQQLAQITSNSFNLLTKNKIKLSSQHLINCISGTNQRCHDVSLQNIHSALQYLQKWGITTQQCIKNRLLEAPDEFKCPYNCQAGNGFPYTVKAKATKHQNINEMLTSLTDDQSTTAIIIFKVFDSFNYYSSENPQYLSDVWGETFQYRVGQVVGWKNKGDDIIVRLGSGEGWGYNGFGNINVNKHKNYIVQLYTLNVISSSATRIQKSQLNMSE